MEIPEKKQLDRAWNDRRDRYDVFGSRVLTWKRIFNLLKTSFFQQSNRRFLIKSFCKIKHTHRIPRPRK